jgi:hypothetical protein
MSAGGSILRSMGPTQIDQTALRGDGSDRRAKASVCRTSSFTLDITPCRLAAVGRWPAEPTALAPVVLSTPSVVWHAVCSPNNQLGGVHVPSPAFTAQPKSRGANMEPLNVAARFAAFACYLNKGTSGPRSPEDAGRYARDNWKCFLPYVHEELGRFLTASRSSLKRRTGHRSTPQKLVV